jgi:hypothetical protein
MMLRMPSFAPWRWGLTLGTTEPVKPACRLDATLWFGPSAAARVSEGARFPRRITGGMPR